MRDVKQKHDVVHVREIRKKRAIWLLIGPGLLGAVLGFSGTLFGNTLVVHHLFWAFALAADDTKHLHDSMIALMAELAEGAVRGAGLMYAGVFVIAFGLAISIIWKEKKGA